MIPTDLIFGGLTVGAWLTIVTVIGVFSSLLFTKIRPEVAFALAIATLYLTDVLSLEEAFSGFDQESVIIVGILFVVISGIKHSGALEWIVSNLMGEPKTYGKAIIRVMLPVGILSSFMSNTATTALFVDVVKMWAKKLKIAASKLLIPLAYAASIGGLMTIIGTPPNLIIYEMYHDKTGMDMSIMTPFPIGISCLIVSIFVVILCRNFFPIRKSLDNLQLEDQDSKIEIPQNKKRIYISIAIIVSMIVLSATNILSLATSCILAAIMMPICKCCSIKQIEEDIDWNTIMVFAGSLCIGFAVDKTGLADTIANKILEIGGSNSILVLLCICLVASITTEFISDTACGAMFSPIAISAATSLGVNPLTFCVALMMAVSNNYSTPIATPPNMLVYMAGGYKFQDFARVGLILKIVLLIVAVLLTPLVYPL